jgi:hypothetical protein
MSTLATFPHAGPLATVRHGEEAHTLLAFKLAPLLAVCEFAARAEHSLRAFEMLAGLDANVRQHLDGIAPEWRTPMVVGGVAQEVGQCLALARELCNAAAEQAQSLARDAEAMRRAGMGAADALRPATEEAFANDGARRAPAEGRGGSA